MPQSLSQIYVHAVFSTKDRRPYLQDIEVQRRLHEYIGGACRELGCPSVRVGGVEDHVHILFRLSRTTEVASIIREIKRESSKWIKEAFPTQSQFAWQSGYGVFSISPSHLDGLTKYISQQADHHARESFQDEFRRLLRMYDIEWDERYVWT
jgi:putative transposase